MRLAALLLALANVLPRCALATEQYRQVSYVFGTVAEITILDDDARRATQALRLAMRKFDRMHRDLHAWRPGRLSELNAALARGERSVRTTPEIVRLIRESQALALRSDDAFNPAIGRLVALWNFHRDEPGGLLPPETAIAALLAADPRMSDLQARAGVVRSRNPAVQLDFGGFAKGYALDRAAEILRASGVRNALIDVGGNFLALGRHGKRPWRVALESPAGRDAMAALDLYDGEAIGTSGAYRRFYDVGGRRYAHIIDPRTGHPVEGVRSATVLVPCRPGAGALSDAATKPVFIAGTSGWRRAAARMGLSQALLVDTRGRIHVTSAFAGRLRFRSAQQLDVVP